MIFIPIGRIFSCSLISESVLDIIKLDFTSENSCFFLGGGGDQSMAMTETYFL